jgi:hypothetical protein
VIFEPFAIRTRSAINPIPKRIIALGSPQKPLQLKSHDTANECDGMPNATIIKTPNASPKTILFIVLYAQPFFSFSR